VPLHLDYRILTQKEKEKRVHHATYWEYSPAGHQVLYGTFQDMSETYTLEQSVQTAGFDLHFKNQLLHLTEQASQTGYWYANLITRKVVYSDAVYRLYGLKPGSIPPGGNFFLNYVHPDDRDVVAEVTKKALKQHLPPDIDFRVVRNDGKVRHLRQQGRVVVYGEGEMVMLVTVRDVTSEIATAQKLAELKLQVAMRQFAQLQSEDMAAMGSWWWDPEADVMSWSESLYRLLAVKPSATNPTHKQLTRAIHPEDRKRFQDEFQLTLNEKRESRFEFRMVRLGEVRQVCASFKLMPFAGKEWFIGTLQDITPQHRLQHQLFMQAQQATYITENMLDRAVITDTENTVLVWNKRCEEAYNIKKESAIGKNIFEILPQLKNETDLALFNRALAGETIFIPASKATPRQEFHDRHLVPLRDEESNVTGILHLLHNVTKEYEMQQRLNERLNFVESLMEASVDRILVMDRHMNYLYCNERAASYYNLHKEDLIGKNVLEVFPASVSEPTHDHFRRALRGETVHIPAIEGISEQHYHEVFLIPIFNEADACIGSAVDPPRPERRNADAKAVAQVRRNPEQHPGRLCGTGPRPALPVPEPGCGNLPGPDAQRTPGPELAGRVSPSGRFGRLQSHCTGQ
jgi:PAS domain S-box-containing protein